MNQYQHKNYQKIALAMSYIRDNFDNQPHLIDVAQHIHLSPYHFQRLFKQWAGVSPKKFLQYTTLSHAKALLTKESELSLLDVSNHLGLSSVSRLHDLFISIEGMTPFDFKMQGKNLSIDYDYFDSPFGVVMIAATTKGICHINFDSFEVSFKYLKNLFPQAILKKQSNKWQQLAKKFFQSQRISNEKIRLHLKGSSFQLKVWEALLTIPKGQVVSYHNIAQSINQPKASRAVGNAIAQNPIAFLIPCHRVILSSGMLGGYRWGVDRKANIIAWESAQLDAKNNI